MKKAYIEKLTPMPHNPPVERSGEEIGPFKLIPPEGSRWFPRERPGGIPAEYHKGLGGTDYFLMRTVYHQQLSGQVAPTQHGWRWLEFSKEERGSIRPTNRST